MIFSRIYNKKESTISRVIIFFTILAILISCLGLFGLSLFVAKRKNKEIGIRKVHGAKSGDIVRMMLKDFIPVIILANSVGLPITLIVMREWLSVFAYKVNPGAGIFIAALIIETPGVSIIRNF